MTGLIGRGGCAMSRALGKAGNRYLNRFQEFRTEETREQSE
jgi:hypothetical protein